MITNFLEIFQKAKKILYILNLILEIDSNHIAIKKIRSQAYFLFGWSMGLEPTTFGTTIRRSNQLS